MLFRSQFQKTETLRFTVAELLSGIGAAGFFVSLALPAIKHGQDQLGINCFTMALFFVFGSSPSPLATELHLMSIASHTMHLCAFILVLVIWNRRIHATQLKTFCSLITILCVLYLGTVPYSSIETVYFGFYLWLASMILIAIAAFSSSPHRTRDNNAMNRSGEARGFN